MKIFEIRSGGNCYFKNKSKHELMDHGSLSHETKIQVFAHADLDCPKTVPALATLNQSYLIETEVAGEALPSHTPVPALPLYTASNYHK